MNVPTVIEIQKNDRAPAQSAGSWDMCREEEVRSGEDAQRGYWSDHSGPRSWLPLVDPAEASAVFRIAPRRLVGKRSFWRSIELSSMPFRLALFRAIFGTSTPRQIMSRKMHGATAMGSCCFDAAAWSLGWESGGAVEGNEYLSFIKLLFGVSPGVAAVRIIEAVTNCKFDAQAASEIQAAVDGWFARGAPADEGRHS